MDDIRHLEELYKQSQNSSNGEKPLWLAITKISELTVNAPPVIVKNLWRQQEVLLLGGHSKSWKSWAQMDLMFCISNGLGWLTWPQITKGPVLHIDLELFDFEIRKRFEQIRDSYEYGSLDNIDVLSLRGVNFRLDDFLHLADWIEANQYIAISFDPTYRMLAGSGLSESDSGVVIDLMNRALQVAKKLNTGVDLLQHFSKGNQSDKRAIDAFSGSGVWGRAPDACVTFREHEDEKCYTVTTDLRHWPHQEPFVVEFDAPRFRLADSKDPERLRVPKLGRPQAFSAESLCKLLESDEYITWAHLKRRAEAAEVKKSTFGRRLKEAQELGYIAQSADDSYFLTSNYVSKFRMDQK